MPEQTVSVPFTMMAPMTTPGSRFLILAVGASIFIAITQETRVANGYLAITSLLLTLFTISAIARRLWLHSEISFLTVLGAVCIYVLLGLSFAFLFEAIGDLGSQPFFATRERETRSDYVYFSFITMATVGFGDLTVGFSEHDPHCMMHVCDLDERLA